MSTKIVLHGGYEKVATNEDNSRFFTEILKGTEGTVRVLVILFARSEDRVDSGYNKVSREFLSAADVRSIELVAATKDGFLEQIKDSDVIYFCGGETQRLQDSLNEFNGIAELMKGKVVAGESAGANILCAKSWSPSAQSWISGIGLVPVKFVPHFEESKLEVLPIGELVLTLRNYEHVVFYQ